MRCIHCDREIPDDSVFCPYCGQDVEEDSLDELQDQLLRQLSREVTGDFVGRHSDDHAILRFFDIAYT